MVSDLTEIEDKLLNLGIRGIFIISRYGLPLLVREYSKTDKLFGYDNTLLSGFLSGLAQFANDQTAGLLSDIGLHTIRLFFDYTEDLLFLVAFDELRLQVIPVHEVRQLMKGSISEIKSAIQEFFADSEKSESELVKNPKEFDKISNLFLEIAPMLDRILFKSHVELLKLIEIWNVQEQKS